jgi:hypothetical protein
MSNLPSVRIRYGRCIEGQAAAQKTIWPPMNADKKTLEPLTRIELATFRYGRSANHAPLAVSGSLSSGAVDQD